jgi:putative colanic acid biosynthesis acetyltransferase WcaF
VDEGARLKYQDLSRFRLSPADRGRPKWFIFLWDIVQATLFRYSPRPLYGWRRFLLRSFGAEIGKKVLVRPSASVTYPWKVSIGDYSWIGDRTCLYSLGQIRIGHHVSIAHDVYLCTGLHDYECITFDQFTRPVTIEDECWIPNDVFVAPGVTIGEGCVVGARSTVLFNLPAGMICYGSPAKPARPRRAAGEVSEDAVCERHDARHPAGTHALQHVDSAGSHMRTSVEP